MLLTILAGICKLRSDYGMDFSRLFLNHVLFTQFFLEHFTKKIESLGSFSGNYNIKASYPIQKFTVYTLYNSKYITFKANQHSGF